jgi:hypothetical protein
MNFQITAPIGPFCQVNGVGRTKVYGLIRDGEIKSVTTQMMVQPTEGQMVRRRAQRRLAPSVRRTHASFARKGSPVLIPGVLTPPKDYTEGESLRQRGQPFVSALQDQ